MDRTRGHRYAGPIGGRHEARHWITATAGIAAAAIGAAGSIGGGLLSSNAASKAGKLSSGEKRALDQQYWQIEHARQWQKMMAPFILEEMGLEPIYGEGEHATDVVGLRRKGEARAEDQLEGELTQEAGQRALRSMRGELPLDPATERDIRLRRLRLDDQVRRAYGPGGDLSSGGRAALNNQAESEAILRSRFNQDQLQRLAAIFQTGIGSQRAEQNRRIAAMSGYPRQVMDFAQIMAPGPFVQGAAGRLDAQYDAQTLAHLGNIFGSAGSKLVTAGADAWNRWNQQPPGGGSTIGVPIYSYGDPGGNWNAGDPGVGYL